MLHTETSLLPVKKDHYFLEISVARPEASDPAVLREPAKTSVEDLGAAAKPRDINKNDCQKQHGNILPRGKGASLTLIRHISAQNNIKLNQVFLETWLRSPVLWLKYVKAGNELD